MVSIAPLSFQCPNFPNPHDLQITSYQLGQFLSQPEIWKGAKNLTQIITDCFSRFAKPVAAYVSNSFFNSRDTPLNEVFKCVSNGIDTSIKMNYAQKLITENVSPFPYDTTKHTENLFKLILEKGTLEEVDNFIAAFPNKGMREIIREQYVMHLVQNGAVRRVAKVLNEFETDSKRRNTLLQVLEHLLQHNDYENAKKIVNGISQPYWEDEFQIPFVKYHLNRGEVEGAEKIRDKIDNFGSQLKVNNHFINYNLKENNLNEAEKIFNSLPKDRGFSFIIDEALFSFVQYHLKHNDIENARIFANQISDKKFLSDHNTDKLILIFLLDNEMLDAAQTFIDNISQKDIVSINSFLVFYVKFLAQRNNFEDAKKVLNSIDKLYCNKGDARLSLFDSYLEMNKLEEAINTLENYDYILYEPEKALKLFKTHFPESDEKRLEEAKNTLEKYIQDNANKTNYDRTIADFLLAILLLKQNNFKEAYQIIEGIPDYSTKLKARLFLFEYLLENKGVKAAEEALKSYPEHEIVDKHGRFQILLRNYFIEHGTLEEAEKSIEEIDIESKRNDPLIILVKRIVKQGTLQEAKRVAEKISHQSKKEEALGHIVEFLLQNRTPETVKEEDKKLDFYVIKPFGINHKDYDDDDYKLRRLFLALSLDSPRIIAVETCSLVTLYLSYLLLWFSVMDFVKNPET